MRFLQKGASPVQTITVIENLVAECRKKGIEVIRVDDLEAAIKVMRIVSG